MFRINRRDLFKKSAGALAGTAAMAAMPLSVKAAKTIKPAPLHIPSNIELRNDVTIAIRNWYVNRCPMICRLPWVPTGERGQEFKFPVQVGGSSQTVWVSPMPDGVKSPFEFNQTMQLQNMVDSVENSIYYGHSNAPYELTHMAGLKAQIKRNQFKFCPLIDAPKKNAKSFVSLLYRASLACGGAFRRPDVVVLSTSLVGAIRAGGLDLRRPVMGETLFGSEIQGYQADWLKGTTIVEAPLLRPYDAIVMTSFDVLIRNRVNPHWNSRGLRGDVVEGDWKCELSLEVNNQERHAFISMG